MKKIIYYITVISILIISGCTDREILDLKPGEPIDPVKNLQYSISGTDVNLTWTLPSSYPDDIIQPVSIFLRINRDGVTIQQTTLKDSPTSYVYKSYDALKKYTIIVKVVGSVNTTDPNVSNLRYSLGASVSF